VSDVSSVGPLPQLNLCFWTSVRRDPTLTECMVVGAGPLPLLDGQYPTPTPTLRRRRHGSGVLLYSVGEVVQAGK